MGIFRPDSPLMRFLAYVADLMILNLVYLISCIPVFTIGAATTALYRVMLNFNKGEDAKPVEQFWLAFRSNFKQATILWLIMLLPIVLLIYYFLLIVSGSVGQVGQFRLLSLLALAVVAIVWSFLWPLQAQFENTVGNTLKNAMLLSVRHILISLLMALLNLLPLLLLFVPGTLVFVVFFWLLLGFSAAAFANTKLALIVFRPSLPECEKTTPSK